MAISSYTYMYLWKSTLFLLFISLDWAQLLKWGHLKELSRVFSFSYIGQVQNYL